MQDINHITLMYRVETYSLENVKHNRVLALVGTFSRTRIQSKGQASIWITVSVSATQSSTASEKNMFRSRFFDDVLVTEKKFWLHFPVQNVLYLHLLKLNLKWINLKSNAPDLVRCKGCRWFCRLFRHCCFLVPFYLNQLSRNRFSAVSCCHIRRQYTFLEELIVILKQGDSPYGWAGDGIAARKRTDNR